MWGLSVRCLTVFRLGFSTIDFAFIFFLMSRLRQTLRSFSQPTLAHVYIYIFFYMHIVQKKRSKVMMMDKMRGGLKKKKKLFCAFRKFFEERRGARAVLNNEIHVQHTYVHVYLNGIKKRKEEKWRETGKCSGGLEFCTCRF